MPRELIAAIESDAFAIQVGLAGGFVPFVSALRRHDLVARLSLQAGQDSAVSAQVLERLVSLLRLRIDARYSNPNDAAISAYLVVLGATAPHLFEAALDEVLAGQNLWWAEQIAREVRSYVVMSAEAETQVVGASRATEASEDSAEATFSSFLTYPSSGQVWTVGFEAPNPVMAEGTVSFSLANVTVGPINVGRIGDAYLRDDLAAPSSDSQYALAA